MRRVLVWGTGSAWDKSKVIIYEDNIEIVGFIETQRRDTEQYKEGKLIITPSEIKKYAYDSIFIASSAKNEISKALINLNVTEDKIIYLWEIYNYLERCYQMKRYLEKKLEEVNSKRIDTIVTGLSYARWGIDSTVAPKSLVNLAMDSSDLYTNYLIAKKALQINNKIKKVIIGLSYFSFEYDSSKIKEYFKYDCQMIYKDLVDDNRGMLENEFSNYNYEVLDNFDYDNLGEMKSEVLANTSLLEYEMNERNARCKEEAIRDSRKDYPLTVKSNIRILKAYVNMLQDYGCEIKFVVFPVNKVYSKYFDEKLKKQFSVIMESLRAEFNFKIFDYFDCDEMQDEDFRDGSHLNKSGGEKFTRILINKVL